MLSSGGIYAVKKRKKPVQKSPKPSPLEGVKSNPSKRHRDRLNCELDKLTSLLPFPEDVRSRLDKLSVLRLSVGYLKAKSFFNVSIKKNQAGWMPDKHTNFQGNGQRTALENMPVLSEGELLLEALNGFILVVTAEGYVFYTSSTIQNYLGFHQSDLVHQSVFELIHTDDRPLFRRQLHWALNPPDCQEANPHKDRSRNAYPFQFDFPFASDMSVNDHLYCHDKAKLCLKERHLISAWVAFNLKGMVTDFSNFWGENFIFWLLPPSSPDLLFLGTTEMNQKLFNQAIPDSNNLCHNVVTYDPLQLPPENSSFMERNFICRFRCLLDNSSGFLTLNFQGRLKFLHGQNKKAEDSTPIPPQLALFALATPLQSPSILEVRTKTLIFQTKHKLDFTPLACDTKGKFVLGYSEMELRMRGTGYQFIHAADMMYCADNHLKMIKTGETGMTVFRLLTKQSRWVWVQANAKLIYRGGKPDYIICKQRALTNEEGEEQLQKRSSGLFSFATGEAVLYESTMIHLDPSLAKGKSFKVNKLSNGENSVERKNGIDPSSLLGALMTQNLSAYVPPHESQFNLERAFADDGAVLNVPGDFCHLAFGGKNSSKLPEALPGQDDPLAAVMDILSDKNGDENDLCNTLQNLDVEQAELERWEKALMKMDSTSPIGDDLNAILSTDFILSCVEDILMKDGSKADEFSHMDLDCTEGNSIEPNQKISLGSMEQKPFGFNTQTSVVSGCQRSKIAEAQYPAMTAAKDSVTFGIQNPVLAGAQNPMVFGAQNPAPFGIQNPVMAAAQNPVVPTPQNTLILTCPSSTRSCPQVPACQTTVLANSQKAVISQSPSTTLVGPTNACIINQHIEIQPGNPISSGHLPQNYVRMKFGGNMAADTPSPISYSPQRPCRSALQKMGCGGSATVGQKQSGSISPAEMLQRDLQQSLQQRPEYLGVNGQQEQHFVSAAQQQALQWPPMQSEQRTSLQPSTMQDHMRQLVAESSCMLVQATEDKAPAVANVERASAEQLLYSCTVAVDQTTSVNQLPLGASPSCMFASCEYQNHVPVTRNGLTFPSIGSTAAIPEYSKIKISPNHSPLRPTCCYENNPSNSVVDSSIISNGEMSSYQSSCQFEPNFNHLSENSICEIPTSHVTWNYSHQFKTILF